MARINEVPFVKGHGTGNDFVVIPDPDGRLDLTPQQVRFLCDRRLGLGADGVLRVVRTSAAPEAAAMADQAEWFMDHRNSDGTTAEMCGNGARVFARYLDARGLVVDDEFSIATRAGVLGVRLHPDHTVSIEMGTATTPRSRALPHVTVGERTWPAVGVLVPNPHAVVFVDDLDHAGDLLTAPQVAPTDVFPDGVNVEFVVVHGPGHVSMRVHERGVGETQSCGTGACAVAWAASRRDGAAPSDQGSTWRVDVPGGTVHVSEDPQGALVLTGPADLVARGTVLLD